MLACPIGGCRSQSRCSASCHTTPKVGEGMRVEGMLATLTAHQCAVWWQMRVQSKTKASGEIVWIRACVPACLGFVKASPSSEINESSEKERAGWERKGREGTRSREPLVVERTFSSIYCLIGQQHDSRY
jgi:hypothetical protein